jgi:hypothetical protein
MHIRRGALAAVEQIALFSPPEGELREFQSVGRDVTDLKHAEDSLGR